MKINNYQGDLTNISAKKEALSVTSTEWDLLYSQTRQIHAAIECVPTPISISKIEIAHNVNP